jgi:hypothetical protein
MPLVFVYGPDSLQARMFDRVGACDVVASAVAPGFALAFDKPSFRGDVGLANLVRRDGERAFGMLYELTRAQIERLEGYYGGYGRDDLDVEVLTLAEGATAPRQPKATAFLARRTRGGLPPSPDALADSLRGAIENEAPEAVVHALEALGAKR